MLASRAQIKTLLSGLLLSLGSWQGARGRGRGCHLLGGLRLLRGGGVDDGSEEVEDARLLLLLNLIDALGGED